MQWDQEKTERRLKMSAIIRKAYAKINLGLDVIGRRPNGYHEVKMVMQTVDLYDELTFEKSEDQEISLTVGDAELPVGADNLICKAAELIRREKQLTDGVKITLKKRIPIAAGMAGGSTDAAAVFHAFNELFGLHMSLREMMELGVSIGADVPYCIMGGTALSEGIGEILTPLPAPPACTLLIAKPQIGISTKYVYEQIDKKPICEHPDIDGMVQAIRDGSLSGITERMGNLLETVSAKEYPVITRIEEIMKLGGAENALMSGSGPTVFGIYTAKEKAEKAAEQLRKEQIADQIFVTGFYNHL